MKINNYSFPHPVLNWNNDVEGTFDVFFSYITTKEKYILNITQKFENQTLIDLLEQKKISYVVHIECSQTFFRESYTFYTNPHTIEISSHLLRDKTTVHFYLCAVEQIDQYKIVGSHLDYADNTFFIDSGAILGFGGEANFFAEKQYDSLNAVSTIMEIIGGKNKNNPMSIDFSSDKIRIELSKDDFSNYSIYKSSRAPIFHSNIVFPVLVEALRKIKDESKYSSTKWFQVLQKKMYDNKYSHEEEDLFEVAQKILDNPISRAFESIVKQDNDNGVSYESSPEDIQ